MEVSIAECPACGATVMGDEQVCSGCGKQLPNASTPSHSSRTLVTPTEEACPRCGAKVPRGVLRCRDCGSYMSPEVEAAAMAQQASRMYATGGSSGGLRGGGAGFGSSAYNQATSPASSSFAEVADDADFDLVPNLDLVDMRLRDVEEDASARHSSGDEDDFEMGDGSAADDYEVDGGAGPSTAVEEPVARAGSEPAGGAQAGGTKVSGEGAAEAIPDLEELGGTAQATPSTTAGRSGPPVPDVPHSVQTGGDALLDAALAEQAEAEKRAKYGRRRPRRTAITGLAPDRILIFCPKGHRIQVQEKHRGRTGRCPNCKALFFVPLPETGQTGGQAGGDPAAPASAAAGDASAASANGAPTPSGYVKWITDVRLHRVNPAKLKLVPGSLEADYQTVDLGASSENLLIAVVFSGSGPFRGMQEPKKKPATRQAMLEHLAAKKPVDELPVTGKFLLTPDLLAQLKIVQPSVPGEESLFADVPVFGTGRIAVRVAPADGPNERAYLSFTLSQFREFSHLLSESYGLADYGAGTSIPLVDNLTEATCHYSEAVMHPLSPERLEYYRADPAIKLAVLGRRCEKCGLVVSEDSRKKEKIGGASDASVAKAKCPKCKAKFGNITLYGIQP
ncbi:MAG TPA: zinc ribbon domain-containing protein [Planctomycetaceae bacterium]